MPNISVSWKKSDKKVATFTFFCRPSVGALDLKRSQQNNRQSVLNNGATEKRAILAEFVTLAPQLVLSENE